MTRGARRACWRTRVERRRRWWRWSRGILSIACISRLGPEHMSVSEDVPLGQKGNSQIFASFLISSRVGLRPSWELANARSQSLSSCLSLRAWAGCGSVEDGIAGRDERWG